MLNSWKEIAAYMGRGVRTVQRWEMQLGLPIHRIGKGKRSPVYTTVGELKFWISTVGIARPLRAELRLQPLGHGGNPLEASRRLLSSVQTLAQSIAENSVRQHRQAEILRARIIQMRSRIK
jgi:hypothetical protein